MIAGLLSKLAQLHPDAPGLALAWEALQIARRALDSADEIKAAYREAERRGALEVARAVKAERALAEIQGQAPQEGIAAAFRALRAVPRHGATLADLAEAIGVRMDELDDVRRERDALSIRLAIHEQARTVEDPDPRTGKPGPGADLDEEAVDFDLGPGPKPRVIRTYRCVPIPPPPPAAPPVHPQDRGGGRCDFPPVEMAARVVDLQSAPPPAPPPVEGCAGCAKARRSTDPDLRCALHDTPPAAPAPSEICNASPREVYPQAVPTSRAPNLRRHRRALGCESCVECGASAEEIAAGKPCPGPKGAAQP